MSKLTPLYPVEIKDENFSNYIDAALKDEKIKNIAVTGSYGSGKSSSILSYFKNNKEHKALSISLINSETSNESSINTSLLEEKLIEQLLHHIESKNIPETSFKLKGISRYKWYQKLTATIFISYILYLLSYSKLQALINLHLSVALVSGVNIVYFVLAVLSFIYICYYILGNFSIKSLKLKNVEATSNEESKSYFNRNLREILYLFENSGYDTILFEDLDRFDNPEIFYSLREINGLLKSSLKFIYLVRDDIFNPMERTKFFDLIIPVIPVVNAANSYEQLLPLVGEYTLDKRFLRKISLYIDDFRLLKNISNEFIVYSESIKNDTLDKNKLFALIVFKNLFPKDFKELQFHRGNMFALIDGKNDYINSKTADIEEKISDIKEKIELANTDVLKSKEELIRAFANKNNWNSYNITQIINGQQPQMLEQLKRDTNFASRYDALENNNKYVKELKEEEQKLKTIRNLDLSKLINADIIDKQLSNISGSNDFIGLYNFLLLGGWISEDFDDYLTLFSIRSLTANDINFLKAIQEERSQNYEENIDKIDEILSIEDFKDKPIFNFKLFNYFLEREMAIPSIAPENNSNVGEFLKEFFVSEPYKKIEYKDLRLFSNWLNGFKFDRLHFQEMNQSIARTLFENELFDKNTSNIIDLSQWVNVERLESFLNKNTGLDENLRFALAQDTERKISFEKEKVIVNYFDTFSVQGIDLSDELLNYILENKLDKDDLPYLTTNYNKFRDRRIGNKVYELNVEYNTDYQNLAETFTLDKILNERRIGLEVRQQLFIDNIGKFDGKGEIEIRNSLENLEFDSGFVESLDKPNKRPTVEDSDANRKILDFLIEQKIISSYTEEINQLRINRSRK